MTWRSASSGRTWTASRMPEQSTSCTATVTAGSAARECHLTSSGTRTATADPDGSRRSQAGSTPHREPARRVGLEAKIILDQGLDLHLQHAVPSLAAGRRKGVERA